MPDERGLMDLYSGPRSTAAAADPDAISLEEIDGEYLAAGIVSPKGLTRIHILRGKEPVLTMQYVQLDSRAEYTPNGFTVLFAGIKTWKVRVTGRNLWKTFDSITRHCCGWIRQADRDFNTGGEPFISKIEVLEVKEDR